MHISKSDYLKFRIHPAYLWYKKHKPRSLPQTTENDQYMFDQGHAFESLVQRQFPDAVEIEGKPWNFAELAAKTQSAIENEARTIFQASFLTDDLLFCRSDILERTDDGWILSEVKSSSSVKQAHLFDLAFQKNILERHGLNVLTCRVVHINRNYVRDGDIDVDRFVAIRDVTEEVEDIMSTVKREIVEAQNVIEQAEVDDHPAYAGDLRAWLPIYSHLHPELEDDSLLHLTQLKPELVRKSYFDGIETMSQLDEAQLTQKQIAQARAWKNGEKSIDPESIKTFLESLKYPLYFLDYETSAHAVPLYDGTRPYQQVPFQYSLHKLEAPESELEHFEYLHQEFSLPLRPLAEKLTSEIGEQGTVLAWFDKFEKYCNRTIGDLEPEFHEQMKALNKRMKDLRIPFANLWYVDKYFQGSSSIKNVLPVLVPELSYKELGIQEGGAAQRLWQQVWEGDKEDQKQQIFDDLLEYCKLDTLAMVEIYRVLRREAYGEKMKDYASVQGSLFS